MKAFIGIFQETDQADRYLDSIGMEPETVVEVGPFLSKFQAVEWMEFMEKKMSNCEAARWVAQNTSKYPWYGFTAAG